MTTTARLLTAGDAAALRKVLAVFAEAFEDEDAYLRHQPDDAYLDKLLSGSSFIAVAGYDGDTLMGGLAAYELQKFEQQRSEVYIYDLAVLSPYRRRGVATALIETLRTEAARRGAWVIYVQADHGDDAAVALYTKLGRREDVMHFDIPTSSKAV